MGTVERGFTFLSTLKSTMCNLLNKIGKWAKNKNAKEKNRRTTKMII